MLLQHVLVNLPIYCRSMWNNSWLTNIIWLIMAFDGYISYIYIYTSQSCMAIRPNVDGLMGQIMLDPRFNTKFTTFSLLPTLQLRRGKTIAQKLVISYCSWLVVSNPSEKYENQLGLLFPIYGKINKSSKPPTRNCFSFSLWINHTFLIPEPAHSSKIPNYQLVI